MGCYPSSQSYCESRMPRREPSIGSLPGIYYNKSKPFKRNGLIWTSDIPITLSELEHKRTLFWQAAPTHGGRVEIWNALQVAFSETDIRVARSILEVANIVLPTGNPCEGCFDEYGNNYETPIFCVVPPTNLLATDNGCINQVFFFPEKKRSFAHQSIYTDYEDNLVPAPDCTRNPHPIIVRLSTDQDLRLIISTKGETVGSLRYRIFHAPESKITPESHILRLIYLGRILHDNEAIVCENNSNNDDDLEWKKPAENIVRIDKETIIQALVSPTSIRS